MAKAKTTNRSSGGMLDGARAVHRHEQVMHKAMAGQLTDLSASPTMGQEPGSNLKWAPLETKRGDLKGAIKGLK